MNATFLDTSFILALASESDELHARALAWKMQFTGPLITSDFIILEIGDALALPEDRSLAVSIIKDLESSPIVEIVPASSTWLEKGRRLFESRPDKAWGLTQALTHDRHFEQAGFHALLREDPPSN